MKKLSRRICLIVYLLLIICSCKYVDRGKMNLENAKSLEVGMKSSEVRLIMGQPDDSVRNYFEPGKKILIYKSPFFSTEQINIWFDLEDKVERIILPKGEKDD